MGRSQESLVTAPDCSYQMGRKEELCLQGLEVSWSNGAQYRQLSISLNRHRDEDVVAEESGAVPEASRALHAAMEL